MRSLRNRSYILDLMIGVLLVTTIFFLVGQRNLSEQIQNVTEHNRSLNLQSKQLGERIASCTDPNGACYKDNMEQTAKRVENINKISMFAAYCSSKTPPAASIAAVRKCIETAITGKEPLQTK